MQSDDAVWQPDLSNRNKPVYLAIADAIADDIHSGRLTDGQRLPPQRTLADRLGLDLTTVSRAYTEARQRGLLDARVGQGTFVRSRDRAGNAGGRPGDDVPARAGRPATLVDMTMNQPPLPNDPDLMSRARQGLVDAMMRVDPLTVLRYPEIGSGDEDLTAGALWLARRLPGLEAEAGDGSGRVITCPGTQSALLALLCMLTEPGDAVCTEALTYPGFRAIARQLGLRVAGVAMDAQGLDPDALRAAIDAHAPKVLYCTPTLHNPTTATLPAERRRAIADIARDRGIAIIEDDIYGVLPPDAPPPIAAFAPDLTFYVSGLAKCVAPGLRVAYVAAPDGRQAMRVAAAQRATVLGTSPVAAKVAARWIEDGTADALVTAIRSEAIARQRMAGEVLPASAMATHPNSFHLWLKLPPDWTRGEFATHLRAHGIAAVVSDTFATAGTPPEALRLCLGAPVTRADCRRVLDTVATALDQSPTLAGMVI
ncbi:aminotransferase-like domain-containing protein [Azospirillum picis]|uniref:DNA-binding transcriptional MocR family regulator n=1 Tax=Azospirillum picis TaxID=488438 RepID=A0ABU0MMC7_9PROT|nr:PLP-dependent aminotransferase family protein [Azospirillum picis]MBP2300655.1 DNA-binding transcriptional MocR family regulator [Azospirillum picis]MDQ0534624.1 DNA-binding transcriptional MocR family regulator [Azospirillum picis]